MTRTNRTLYPDIFVVVDRRRAASHVIQAEEVLRIQCNVATLTLQWTQIREQATHACISGLN